MKLTCIFCKTGNVCPMHSPNTIFKAKNILELSDLDSVSPPSIFVGSGLKYPNVNVGLLTPPEPTEHPEIYSAQNYWSKNNYSIKEIIDLRSKLINSRFKTKVENARSSSKLIEISQEVGMSIKPVELEIELSKKISMKLDLDKINLPMGPRGQIKNARITQNPKIPHKIQKVVSDTDLKSTKAIEYLYNQNFDEQILTQLLSIGSLGLKKNRTLVPTRWAITATDDTIGKFLINKIKDYNLINDYILLTGNYLGNYYYILLFPDIFSFELYESYLPKSSWNNNYIIQTATDYESIFGRKSYVKETAGGYYATRIAVLEFLSKIRRQASCLVFRFETPEYYASLGVFIVRSAARKTMQNPALKFKDKKSLLNYSRNVILSKFRFDIKELLRKSKLIESQKQKKLSDF